MKAVKYEIRQNSTKIPFKRKSVKNFLVIQNFLIQLNKIQKDICEVWLNRYQHLNKYSLHFVHFWLCHAIWMKLMATVAKTLKKFYSKVQKIF
jgi:hypothetical protein